MYRSTVWEVDFSCRTNVFGVTDCGEIATVMFNVKLEKAIYMLGVKNGGQGRKRWKW